MKHFVLLASVLLAMPAWARTLSPAEALQRAQGDAPAKVAGIGKSSRLVKTGYTAAKQPAYYIFDNSGDKGYMILAADDVAAPVLGYSLTGTINPDDMPENLRGWLENYAAEIAWAAERQESGNYVTNDLTKKKASSSRASWTAVGPLCATKWNQSNPYDLYTPEITYRSKTMKAATGCVATAMAQLMKYHNYPANGKGSISYTWKKYTDFSNTAEGAPSTNVTMSMNFSNTTFEWDKMLDVYPNSNYTTSDANANAVATLMKACGYSVEMSYGPESGAVTSEVADALKTYFGYDGATRFYTRAYYDIDTWEEMLYNNLKNVGPIQYSGRNDYGGHSFIVDGYSTDGYFHLNWGWGGVSDGYFLITGLDPDAQGIGGSVAGYNSNQGAILGAQPAGATIPRVLPFQLAIVRTISGEVSGQKLVISGRFGNNGGDGTNVRLAMQFCNATTDQVVATAVYGTMGGVWNGSINYGINSMTATIPSDLPAGVYKVYPVASTDGGTTYEKAIAPVGEPNYILFAKDDDGTYQVAQAKSLSIDIENFTLDTPVYEDTAFGVTATAVNNNDSEVMQEVNLGFITSDNRLFAVGSTMVIDLRAGKSMKLPETVKVVQGSVTAGTTYYLAYVDMNTGMILSDLVTVTVQAAPAAAVLQTTSTGFSVVDAESVMLDNFRVNFDVYCKSGYYADQLYVLIFNENLSGTNIDYLVTPSTYFIEAENWIHESNVKLGTPSNLEVGKRYAAAVFYRAPGLKQLSAPAYFTVGAVTGINDIKAESADGSVSALLQGGILSVTAASDIRSIDVYDLSGSRVASSTTSTADLTGAADGMYVVRVTTADGTASLKLMK